MLYCKKKIIYYKAMGITGFVPSPVKKSTGIIMTAYKNFTEDFVRIFSNWL